MQKRRRGKELNKKRNMKIREKEKKKRKIEK